MPSLQDLEKPESELSSELYSSDNKLLGKYFRYNRSPIEFNDLSEKLIKNEVVIKLFSALCVGIGVFGIAYF